MSDLRFRSVTLNNFKCFIGKHVFKLGRSPGLYYIAGANLVAPELGANGVGKTTLGDAITWVCWDKTGKDNRPGSAIEPWGSDDHCFVKLRFSRYGEKEYHYLIRSRHPNSLTLDGKPIAQKDVPALIGMSEEMFRRSMILGQFGTLFMDVGPEKQSQMFNEALDLDIWLKASKAADTRRKEVLEECFKLRDEMREHIGKRDTLKESLREAKQDKEDYDTKQSGEVKKLSKQVTNKAAERKALLKKVDCKSLAQLRENMKELKISANKLVQTTAKAEAAAAQIRKTLAQAKTNLEEYNPKSVCPTCGQTMPKERVETIRLRLREQIAQYEEDLKKLSTTELEGLEDKALKQVAILEEVEDEVEEVDIKLKELNSGLSKYEHDTNPHDATVDTVRGKLKKVRADIEANETAYKTLEASVEQCSYWQDAYKEIRLSLIDQVLSELEVAVLRHAEQLGLEDWGIKFQTERETKAGNVSTGFTVVLHPPGKDPVKWESYSGGESQRWQLAMAFGLSEIILARAGVNPNIEILDEPTRGLSPEGVKDLLEHLRERALELDRCIYVVEHHSLESGAFDGTIVVERRKDGSRIVEGDDR